MAEPANAEDRHEIAWARAGIAQRIEGGDAGAEQRRRLDRREVVGDRGKRLDRRDHVVGITAVIWPCPALGRRCAGHDSRRAGSWSHTPQWPPCQPTPTRCPTRHAVTSGPDRIDMARDLMPRHRADRRCRDRCRSTTKESLWQMPQASTLIRTLPGPGSGIGRSTSSSGDPGFSTCTARMGRTPFDVGLQPKIWLAAMPLKIDCTAMAASSTPNTRTITLRAVSPIRWWISWASRRKIERHEHHGEDREHHRARAASGRPWCRRRARWPMVMAPGPASSGVASGNTVISACCSALLSASSLSFGVSWPARGASTASCRAR